MTAGIIDESAIADALRLGQAGARAKQILSLQGLGLWHGDLSDMRRDSPRRPVAESDVASPNITEAADRMMMVLRVKAALKQLPALEREVLRLRFDEQLQIEEIAKRLDVKADRAGMLMRVALHHVKKIYAKSIREHGEL